ncbi:MAG TPA: hypothetical protein VF373_04975 [Prolixibacteraceae bacterium]
MKTKSFELEDSTLEQKLVMESEMVKEDSMLILKDFEEIDDFGADCNSSDDFESSDE